MSSADSSFLATSSLLSKNVYKTILRPKAPDYEVLWVLRCGVVATAAISAGMALTMDAIVYISYLCSDFVYVTVFPQLLLSVHWKRGTNSYGAITSFLIGTVMRMLGE
ncbi:hypothetical protein J437_LFUL003665 [Ladona fulva]|uniref:Uncharacterized protein n=1 Tax=Ladona fulva TaxID=123851 RepID=A0A8K0K5S1_LADFU|nr:hypothetical protein J437_LFUL003665 [Ladona fulva]